MHRLLLSLVLFAAAVPGLAQKFVYGSYFDYYFDNREFDRSHEKYMESETLHSVLVAPELGLSFKQGEDTEHRILVGTDIMRDTGSGAKPGDSFREVTVYYNVRSRFGNDCSFEAAAGVFPRRLLGGSYSRAIWSDAHTFYDMNMEGVLLKYGAPAFNTEIGCDWMGMYSADRRERFQIFSSGEWKATDWLSAGWGLSFYHYATSAVAHNVIDNHLLNPWLKADAAGTCRSLPNSRCRLVFSQAISAPAKSTTSPPCLWGRNSSSAQPERASASRTAFMPGRICIIIIPILRPREAPTGRISTLGKTRTEASTTALN